MPLEGRASPPILRRLRGGRFARRAKREAFPPLCGKSTRTVRFAGSAVASGCPDPLCSPTSCDELVKGIEGAGHEGREGQLRGLLLQAEPPVCARLRRAVSDVPPEPPGGPAPAAAAALRLPPGAPAPGGVGAAERAGASRAARVNWR